MQTLEVRTLAKAGQVKISVDDASKLLRKMYEDLFKYIEALEIISPNEGRKPLINELNSVIGEFNIAVKTR